MFRGVTALFVRMLREDGLSSRPHLLRFTFLMLTSLVLFFAYELQNLHSAAGQIYFAYLTSLNIVFLFIVGLLVYSSAISEERELGTLGLLKMTGVSRLAILLGKSTSWLSVTLQILLLQTPFLMLAVTLGGITPRQIISSILSLGAFAVLLCNFSLFCSLVCRTTRGACFASALCMGFYLVGPMSLSPALARISASGILPSGVVTTLWGIMVSLCDWLKESSVISQLILSSMNRSGVDVISFQVISNLAGGALFFGLAWFFFERCTRNPEPYTPKRHSTQIVPFRRSPERQRRSLRVWRNPFSWQEYQFVRGGDLVWWQRWLGPPTLGLTVVAIFIIHSTWVWYSGQYGPNSWFPTSQQLFEIFLGVILWAAIVLFSIESLFGSARLLGDEFREGTLSALTLLPRRVPRIVYSKVVGEVLGFVPYLALAVAACLGFIMSQPALRNPNPDAIPEMLYSAFVTVIVYFLAWHLVAWLSLHLRRGAIGLALVTLGLGYVVMIFSVIAIFGIGLFLSPEQQQRRNALIATYVALVLIGIIAAIHLAIFRRIKRIARQA